MATLADIRVGISPASASWLRRTEKEFPKIGIRATRFTLATILARLRGTIRKGGGQCGVDKFAPLDPVSPVVRPENKLGGKLVSDIGSGRQNQSGLVRYWRNSKGATEMGWVDNVKGIAAMSEMFQNDAAHWISPATRGYLAQKIEENGAERSVMPRSYLRPSREVVDPFLANQAPEIADLYFRTFKSQLRKYMERKKK